MWKKTKHPCHIVTSNKKISMQRDIFLQKNEASHSNFFHLHFILLKKRYSYGENQHDDIIFHFTTCSRRERRQGLLSLITASPSLCLYMTNDIDVYVGRGRGETGSFPSLIDFSRIQLLQCCLFRIAIEFPETCCGTV